MITIVGATGNVGYATARALREAGESVRAVVHDPSKAPRLASIGCEIAVLDLREPASLARAMAGADAVQVVVPLRPKRSDPVADMRRSIEALIVALERARPPRIVAISDYGAHVTEDIGMPTIFHDFERRLARLAGRKTFLRSAEHVHALAPVLPSALDSGILMTFQDPVDAAHPMIAAPDLGRIAADALRRGSTHDVEVVHAEGPRRISARETASVLGELAGRSIGVEAIPRSEWRKTLERTMPPTLAALLVRTNEAKNAGGSIDRGPEAGSVVFGTTELIDALRPFVRR